MHLCPLSLINGANLVHGRQLYGVILQSGRQLYVSFSSLVGNFVSLPPDYLSMLFTALLIPITALLQ